MFGGIGLELSGNCGCLTLTLTKWKDISIVRSNNFPLFHFNFIKLLIRIMFKVHSLKNSLLVSACNSKERLREHVYCIISISKNGLGSFILYSWPSVDGNKGLSHFVNTTIAHFLLDILDMALWSHYDPLGNCSWPLLMSCNRIWSVSMMTLNSFILCKHLVDNVILTSPCIIWFLSFHL